MVACLVLWEVRKPETINYRTFKPERDGCLRQDLRAGKDTSACAASTSARTVAWSARVRRGGHAVKGAPRCAWVTVELASRRAHLVPQVAPLAYRADSRHDAGEIERVLYFRAFVVIDPGMTQCSGAAPDRRDVPRGDREHGDEFDARHGAEAVPNCCSRSTGRPRWSRSADMANTSSETKSSACPSDWKLAESFLDPATSRSGW